MQLLSRNKLLGFCSEDVHYPCPEIILAVSTEPVITQPLPSSREPEFLCDLTLRDFGPLLISLLFSFLLKAVATFNLRCFPLLAVCKVAFMCVAKDVPLDKQSRDSHPLAYAPY